MGVNIGFTFNLKSERMPTDSDPRDLNAELDKEKTIQEVEDALHKGGHKVTRIGNVNRLLEYLPTIKDRFDIILNIAEGYEGRNRESQIPILLEMVGMPYIGSDALTLGLTLDKVLTKKILVADGIPTPGFAEIFEPEDIDRITLKYPLIVKLRYEGSSKGLSDASVVENPKALRAQVEHLRQAYHNAAIFVEEFIEGTEFTVGIIGNSPPRVYPVAQIALDGSPNLGRNFFKFEYLLKGADYLCPAPIAPALTRKMQEYALKVYRAVDSRDIGRVDYRVDKSGKPYVLEINPLPSLSRQDAFQFMASAEGATYEEVINQVVDVALLRYRLKPAMQLR